MGRPDANSGNSQHGGQQNQHPQEYQYFHPQAAATQSPETIDDAPPPFESSNDENHQEIHEGEPQQEEDEMAPYQNHHQTRSGPMPMAFPPQSPKTNPSHHHPAQFPPQNTQMRSPPSVHDHNQPQPYPPPTHQGSHHEIPQAFPPPQPQSFPPPQSFPQPQAFPPQQGAQPQPFPPSQGAQPQPFPPSQGAQPQAFPPSQGDQPQAFPPPQSEHAFPPQQQHGAFMQQQNMPHFQQGSNFSTMGSSGMSAGQQIPMYQPMPNSPLVHPNPQVLNTPLTGFPVAQALPTEPWKTGLFGCMEDPMNALITACFPCVTFGQIAEIIDSGQTSCSTSAILYGCVAFVIGLPCLLSCTYRTKLRGRFGLIESPAPDWITHCLCECCALCQEYRELQLKGLDPSIGWAANLTKSQQMVAPTVMIPPTKQTMAGWQ